ncbi:MAG TPA: cysteine hydrolase [Telluria sp.]
MKRKLHLLIIDPQNDFCDLPAAYVPEGVSPALAVPGAHADMQRVAKLIRAGGEGLGGISVTIDSHHRIDVAHPAFWMDANGGPVGPFSEITAADLAAGKYVPRDARALPRVSAYLQALEAAGRYKLMVWPTHCEIGSWGQNVHADVRAAYNQWEESTMVSVAKVVKGTNPWTEHYSAIEAEVPDADDDNTQMNVGFVRMLAESDKVYITGEAGSHCVKATTEHIVQNWDPAQLSKLVLVTDCMSAVTGFEAQYQEFLRAMQAKGVQVAQSADVQAQLAANAKLR